MDICIDFDGTCVTHEFPKVGKDIGALAVLKELVENGHNLILFTMRSNVTENKGYSSEVPEVHNGPFLDHAVEWFKKNGIPLHGINVNPQQHEWTTSPKAYGQIYIDDAALGAPLIHVPGDRPYMDWDAVRSMLIARGVIKQSAEDLMVSQQIKFIEDTVNYCREKDRQVKGFGHAALEQIAGETKMSPEMKAQISDLIDNPTKAFKAGFRKNA